MDGEEMKKKKEYIIAGSLLSLAIVGMVFAYNTESGDKKLQEKEKKAVNNKKENIKNVIEKEVKTNNKTSSNATTH